MKTFSLTIDGRAHVQDTTFEVLDPATENVLAHAPECSPLLLDTVIASAQRAFPTWRKDKSYRREVLKQCAQIIHRHVDELTHLLTREQGKPLARATWEITLSMVWIPKPSLVP